MDADDPELFAFARVFKAAFASVIDNAALVIPVSDRTLSTFISVDFPAPFSPTIAWISPRSTLRLTLFERLDAG
jgi:hypothetical protein